MLAKLLLLHKKINLWSFYIVSLLLAVGVVGFWILMFISMIAQSKVFSKNAFFILLVAVITSFLSIRLFLFTKKKLNEVKNETIESQEKKMEEWKVKIDQFVDIVKQSPLTKPQFKIPNPTDILRPTLESSDTIHYPQNKESKNNSPKENLSKVEYITLTSEDFKKLSKLVETDKVKFKTTITGASSVLKAIKIEEEDVYRALLESYSEIQSATFLHPDKEKSEGAYSYYLKHLLKTGFELNKSNYAALFKIVEEVTTLFQIKPKIRIFKVKQGGTENAFVLSSGDNLILAFCDNILNLIKDEKELRYIVGHELGHYIYGHCEPQIHNNIFALHRSEKELSYEEKDFLSSAKGLFFLSVSCLIRQMQELNADRAGLYACGDFESSVSASLKVTAGSIDEFGKYDSSDYLTQANNLIQSGQYFEMNDIFRTHPIEALRVKALELFYYSDLYSKKIAKSITKYYADEFLTQLFYIIPLHFVNKEMDKEEQYYAPALVLLILTSIGVMIADKKIDRRELAYLENLKMRFAIYEDVNEILKNLNFMSHTESKQETILKEYANKIGAHYSDYARIIIDNMIQVAKSDAKIAKEEIQFILTISEWMNATQLCQSELQNHFGWKFALDKEGNVTRES